jgi:hypothetical protein
MTTDTCRLCDPQPQLGAFSLHDQHPECGLRMALGGIGHLTNHAHWCLEMHDPDAGLSYRESALLVAKWVEDNGLDAAVAVTDG